jgi:hypothetical protein
MITALLARDAEVLAAVGRFRMLTRPQVKHWFFDAVSEPVVTRFLQRAQASGQLGIARLGGNGVQVLWLTRKGRDALVSHGASAADLFPATGPAAAKDFDHTAAIAEAAIWLALRTPSPDELLPAWTLARFFGGSLAAIPDLLALWRSRGDVRSADAALAVEVDLGTEPLRSVLVPKLRALAGVLDSWLPGTAATILVLVPSMRRRDTLRSMLGDVARRVIVEVPGDAFTC